MTYIKYNYMSTATVTISLYPATVNPAYAHSPCPHKETGHSPGLPNGKGELAREN